MTEGNALGDHLRARRELVQPADVGLPGHGVRRVSGLRREEVATLAGISSDYYLRLEQGRDRNPSTQVLHALARGGPPRASACIGNCSTSSAPGLRRGQVLRRARRQRAPQRAVTRDSSRPQSDSARSFHPQVGDITLGREKLAVNGTDGQVLATYHAEPGTPDAEKMARLSTMSPPSPA